MTNGQCMCCSSFREDTLMGTCIFGIQTTHFYALRIRLEHTSTQGACKSLQCKLPRGIFNVASRLLIAQSGRCITQGIEPSKGQICRILQPIAACLLQQHCILAAKLAWIATNAFWRTSLPTFYSYFKPPAKASGKDLHQRSV